MTSIAVPECHPLAGRISPAIVNPGCDLPFFFSWRGRGRDTNRHEERNRPFVCVCPTLRRQSLIQLCLRPLSTKDQVNQHRKYQKLNRLALNPIELQKINLYPCSASPPQSFTLRLPNSGTPMRVSTRTIIRKDNSVQALNIQAQ